LYTSVLRYFSPESTISVTTVAPGPSRRATLIAATTFAPEVVARDAVVVVELVGPAGVRFAAQAARGP
jgi:hypothetical protein